MAALRRMVNARTGGGLSLLKGRVFSTPAAPKKLRTPGALRVLIQKESWELV